MAEISRIWNEEIGEIFVVPGIDRAQILKALEDAEASNDG
jgi:hypothetical protein